MRHAILIHAHHLPGQFGRLCRALSHPDFDIYANIDAKADINDFIQAAPQVNFIMKRTDIKWGRWSQVEATLNSLSEIVATGEKYGYILFISGQDFPTRPLGEVAEYLEAHNGDEFIAGSPLSDINPKNRRSIEMRYTKRRVFLKWKSLSMAVNKLLRLLPDKKHIYPLHKGSSWWNLTYDSVCYTLDLVHAHPEIARSYRHSFCPDEMFFQSVLYASPFNNRIVNKTFRYIDWSQGKANPKTLLVSDFDKITTSDAWFARKIDTRQGSELLDMLDRHIANNACSEAHI